MKRSLLENIEPIKTAENKVKFKAYEVELSAPDNICITVKALSQSHAYDIALRKKEHKNTRILNIYKLNK